MDKFSQLRSAGFSDTEINNYLGQQSSKLLSAGFSQEEVSRYLGAPPPPNDAAIRQVFKSNLDKASAPGEDGQSKPLDFMQALDAGFGMSVSGLATQGKLPEKQMTGNEAWYNRIAYSAAQMIGDVPAMIAGAAVGGGATAPTIAGIPVGAMGGAFALPAGLRSVMVDAYSKGEFKTFGDFFERASGILLDTAKGYVTGAATAGVAGKVGQMTATAAAPVRSVAQMTAEIGTMVTVGSALERHVPSAQDFLDAGVLLLGAKGSVKAAEVGAAKLREVYKKTGVTPTQVLTDAKTDPTITQDLATGREIPRAYEGQVDPMFKPEPVVEPTPATPVEPPKFGETISVEGKDPHTVSYEHGKDGRLTRTVEYPDGERSVATLVTDKKGDETWVSNEQYQKREYYPKQLTAEEANAAMKDDLANRNPAPVVPVRTAQEKAPEPSLYREGNADAIAELLDGMPRTSGFGENRVYAANAPELALGQGPNQGILVELNPAGFDVKRDMNKPAATFLGEQGKYEVLITPNDGVNSFDYIRSITLSPTWKDSGSRGFNLRVENRLNWLVREGKWTVEETDAGKVFRPVKTDAAKNVVDGIDSTLNAGAAGSTAPPPTTPQQIITQRQALVKMADNLGVEVREVDANFHSSSAGYIAVPAEGARNIVPGITDAEFVFAHEFGHAIMQRRGALFGRQREDGRFSFWSNAKLQREISNWNEFTDASKEMRPEFWNDPQLGQQKYVRTPDELIADTIASVLTGKRDISILYPLMQMVGMKPEGMGVASGGGNGGKPPGSFPTPAAGGPEPGSLGEAQSTILSKVNIGGKVEKEPLSFEKLYTASLDDLAPIKNVVAEMAGGKDIPANADPYIMARLTRGVYGKAQQALENATFDFATLKNNGKSLKDIIEPVRDDLNGLRAYAISARALELKDRFIVSGFDIDAAAKVVKETSAKFEPIMRELVEYQNRITAYLRDSGVLSDEAYAAMLDANKSYVPFYRVFEDAASGGMGSGLRVKNPIKQIKGSGLDVVDPIESIIKNTYTYLSLADRNAATKAFYDLGLKSGTPDAFFEKQPTPLRATKVTEEEMARFLKENGIDQMPADALTVFRAMRQPLAKDEIGFFDSGKWTVLKVDPMVAEAFNATDRTSASLLMQMLSAPAKALRAGSTLSPDFMARNFVRDQFSAFVNSKVGFIPIYDTFRGVASIFRKDADFQNWLKSGGANATLVALDRQYIQSEIFKLTGENPSTNFLGKTWNVATKPIEWLRVTSELIENATRLGEFKRAADGTSKSTLLEAGMASREITLDFARVGTQMRAMNMLTAFLNSQLQGVDKSIRSISENPMGAATKIGVAITLPSVLLWMANHDDPRWKEIPAWQRDLFWIVMTEDTIYRIPKPFELGVIFGSSVERMLDAVVGDLDKRDVKEFLKTFGGGFVPNMMPTFAAPVLEQVTNHSFFSGHDLVPSYLEDPKMGVLPEYRYNEYTTELTKALGHIVGTVPGVGATSTASPIVIENYLRSWTGGLGAYALQAADAGLRKAGVLPDPVKPESTLADIPVIKAFVVRYPAATAESIQRFREDYNDRRMVYNTIQTLAKQGDFDASMRVQQINPLAFVKLDQMDQALNQMNQMIRLVYKNPDIPPDEKRQIIDATYYNMIQMTRSGNQMMKQIDDVLPGKTLSR